jgi:hypothetical protein
MHKKTKNIFWHKVVDQFRIRASPNTKSIVFFAVTVTREVAKFEQMDENGQSESSEKYLGTAKKIQDIIVNKCENKFTNK